MHSNRKRPYEKQVIKRRSAIIFVVGLLALFSTVAIVTLVALPGVSSRLENLPFYARTYYRKLVPHPEYLPTPAPTQAAARPTKSGAASPRLTPLPALQAAPTATATPSAETPPVEPTTTPVTNTITLTETSSIAEAEAQPAAAINPAPAPVEAAAALNGINHQWQTWNNCGPATITMNMSYFGRSQTQADAAPFLKPNKEDKNVNPHELAAYARTADLQAQVRQGGSLTQLKQFLSNGLPVLAETWLTHDGDGLGHYRLLTGYDDTAGQFTTYDSLNGPDFTVSYEQFDADWRVFNRLYVIVYPAEQADLVAGIIGPDMDDTQMYRQLVAEAHADIETNPQDAIAHFNLGDALTRLERFEEAATAFDEARQLGLHWRRLWYQFTPFEAYYAVGRYQDVLELAEATISGTGGLEEAYYYQGLALHALEEPGAEEAFNNALEYHPGFTPAQEALQTLTDTP